MKTIFPGAATAALCAALSAPGPAEASLTNIAQLPLLNITGTGMVKPNLMLLFDNSGSMDSTYTPDYVNDSLCRSGSTLADGVRACDVGHPPFMSADFNKQYYNPAIRYQAPIKYDGTYYPDMTSAATSGWTAVPGDGFGAHSANLFGSTVTTSNLATGFPDVKWCNSSGVCQFNTASYSYPTNAYTTSTAYNTGPYYYTIGVAEYCTNDTMSNCTSVSAGAAAPAGYPVPAKVRWCTDRLLVTCQAKRVGAYIYPRYSTATGALASYGTIAIGASSGASALTITSATIADPSTARTITNGTVTAASGTDTALKQQTVASALAASVNARTGLSNQYWACVRTPIGTATVSPCSSYGITLGADNVVAVIPISCVGGVKSASTCTPVTDSSRSGWGITVTAPTVATTPAVAVVPTTAVITIAGTTSGTTAAVLANVVWNGTTLLTNLTIGKSKSASTAASTIVSKINTNGIANIAAYLGGDPVTPTCAAMTSSSVCIVNTSAAANVGALSVGALSNAGTMTLAAAGGAGYSAAVPAATDTIATTTAALSAGSSAPSTFARVNIVSGATYPKASGRTDCVASAGVCTYTEEMVNFANWYAYYKSRLQMMKSSVGIAFSALTANYRVGYVNLSVAGVAGPVDLVPGDFVGSQRSNWYAKLYNTTTTGSTPIRAAMNSVGQMFANLSPYNYAAGNEVVQYPCQQNFMVLTTDGYWNGTSAAGVLNNDNVDNVNRFCSAARGCVDARAQTQPSISDVALYWYNGGSNATTVSLRPPLEPDMSRPGVVPAAGGENTHLHMNTYTLGLGVDGVMNYEANYDTAPRVGGDFYNLITSAATGCPWNGSGAYVWPDPQVTSTASTVQERVDDLWHAAINGHGKYFSASEPREVVEGLSAAIANMAVRSGAAAAAATSTPNISQQDDDIFSDTFTTVKWYGELSDKQIDLTTGVVGETAVWNTSDKVGMKVAAASDTRTIYMINTAAAGALKAFTYGAMSATEKAWFDNKCTLMTQCTLLSGDDRAIVNSGNNLVNWLRGQQQYANDDIFRAYSLTSNTPAGAAGPIPIVLGDIASSKPAFLRDARKSFDLAGYPAFKEWTQDLANRPGTVFTAANDGMLHAFNASTGEELWGYAPRITMKKLYNQASTTYGTNHQFTTDGSPELGDVQIGGVWKSVLVAGLNGGGRGFYALDVTNPATPVALWELCADGTVCGNNDPDIGLTFGNPQFGMWRGSWVVYLTSGYNNAPGVDGVATGDGQGYLYIVDVSNGHVLKKVGTGSGSAGTPSGLAKITAISNNPFTDPVTTYIYGGDNQGQMWRFDLTDTASGAVDRIKMGDAGVLQPVTTRPEVTQCLETDTVEGAAVARAQRVVVYGTGRLLDVPDTTNTDVQSLYMLKDKGSTIALRGATMVAQTLSLQGSSVNSNTYTVSDNGVDLSVKDGWYLDWTLNAGERMNLDPVVVGGGLNVVTNMPSSSSACSVGGSSNTYQVNVCTGSYVASDAVAGRTLSNTSAAVGFIIVRLPSGALKMITTTASGSTITTGVTPPSSGTARKSGWRRVKSRAED